ncbi:YbjQ family protein [Flavobacteriaceae bacterium]|nr:YbjQ family protein [Flavobacteriaceae bacterium]
MIIVNTPTISNKTITQTLGIARGSTVRARNIGQDVFAGLKNIIGGEISEYTKLQEMSREQALQRMIEDAEKMGANSIVNVRLTTSMVMQGCSEILAYGTAVIIE